MKKRRRSRSRKSSGPASPSRPGEPASPCRSGESASSDRSGESASPDRSGEAAASSDRSGERSTYPSADPDREDGDESMQHRMSEDGDGAPSGEGASSASAAPDREGGDEIMQHRRSEDRDGSPSPGEETAVRPKRRHKKEKGRVSGSVVPIPSGTLAEATVALVSDPVVPVSFISGEPASPAGSALPNSDHNANLQVTALHRDFSFISGKPASCAAADYMDQWSTEKHEKERERKEREKEEERKEHEIWKERIERQEERERKQRQEVKERNECKEKERKQRKERKKRKKEKRREKEKQILSDLHMQHDGALVIEESSTALEQQQDKTPSLSPNPLLTIDPFADLQDAGEASETSAAPPSGKMKGKRVGHKGRRKKISSSDSTHASPPREEKSIKQKGCLHDSELLMDQSALRASHGSSRSGDAQEEAPFDPEETSLWLKMDNKPKPSCSGDCGKIAQDEDEHSDKKPSSVVEDEHSDEIGVHAIEDHKQEQGMAVRHVQALLDIDNDTMKEKIFYCLTQLKDDSPKDPFYWSEYDDPQQLTELYRRLALYRIRGYDYELSVDRKLAELDDVTLAQHYPPPILDEEGYFDRYEEYLEWYFDPELCKYAGFEDYQRLVLRNDGLYRDWDRYKSTLHTYEKDLAYVQYCEAIENETKWVDDYLLDCPIPWERVENVAYLQSLEVAAGFRNVSPSLLVNGFKEYIRSLRTDFWNYKADLDGVYFEIWKRVAKRKMDFREALFEVYQQKMFPFRSFHMELDLENPSRRWSMKAKYDEYVACIGDSVSDDEALPLITEAVKKMSPKSKDYVDYAKKKLDTAKEIRLVMEGRRTEIARQCKGDDDKTELKMHN